MNKVLGWLKSYYCILIAVALIITGAVLRGDYVETGVDGSFDLNLNQESEFLKSDLIGEGSGTNVEVSSEEEMVDIYNNTIEPLMNNLLYGTNEEAEYTSATVTLKTVVEDMSSMLGSAAYGADVDGSIEQYVFFAITEEVMYVKLSTDTDMTVSMSGFSQSMQITSVVEYYVTRDGYYVRVSRFDGDEASKQSVTSAYAYLGGDVADSCELIFYGDLFNTWVDVSDTEFGELLTDNGVNSCFSALQTLAYYVDDGDFTGGETPELYLELNGTQNTYQFKYINNTDVKRVSNVKSLVDALGQ